MIQYQQVKFRSGGYKYPVTLIYFDGRIFFSFGFNRGIINEIKELQGRKYHGPVAGKPSTCPSEVKEIAKTDKLWSIPITQRNRFRLKFLVGGDPFKDYDCELITHNSDRPLFSHQKDFVAHGLTRKRCIIAGEMGLGKTLAAIEIIESSKVSPWLWIGPKSANRAVQLDFKRWSPGIEPKMLTYESLVRIKKQYEDDPTILEIPKGMIVDESARIKTPTAQRSEAVKWLADLIREDDGYIILMSGAPAPKSPADWWHQCEVACPGFLKEGNYHNFMLRLGKFDDMENPTGGVYKKRITWWDDENKCLQCGENKDDIVHNLLQIGSHEFVRANNEVAKLYDRMNGLVLVRLKKDCLDLPDKIYREIVVKPKPNVLRAAKILTSKCTSAATALIKLRQLSDGFQYEDVAAGTKTCTLCHGVKKILDFVGDNEGNFNEEMVECPHCAGKGSEDNIVVGVSEVECPKDAVLKDILDEHIECGRLVTYAGFQASVDRCVRISKESGWATIRVDGRGWEFIDRDGIIQHDEPLTAFQSDFEKYPRINFVGQPGAAGEGLTLTASPTIFYYSNDFNANSRLQSEDRIHRIGLDPNKGATIIDVFHLSTDKLVLDNLRKKKRLQALSLGDVIGALDLKETTVGEKLF